MNKKYFVTRNKQKVLLPIFFPDATRGVVKTVDSQDILSTKTPGILVNTYHLFEQAGYGVIKKHRGIKNFMSWPGIAISDSGGFQVMSLAKKSSSNKISDKGVIFPSTKVKNYIFTPEESIRFQLSLKTDLVVVLDDFTESGSSFLKAQETVNRTILWARRSKKEFKRLTRLGKKPYLISVVQGGDFTNLRAECAKELLKIGFDGFGFGGWPITPEGKFNYKIAEVISKIAPPDYFLYGLGIGKPEEVAACFRLGYQIFDCVLPTRDARHRRLYVYKAKSIKKIKISGTNFYQYYLPDKKIHANELKPVSRACDCLLCQKYSRSYLYHLFKIKDPLALRLATIHNLRFYSLLMEKLRINR